jgi:eukaryotic-like serine/threonine-protein kinase
MTDPHPIPETDAATKQNPDPTVMPEEVPPPHTPTLLGRSGKEPRACFPSAGDSLHGFELLRELGRGSFACVFLARQTALDRLVALKVSANRGQEARTLAGLEHDHIVRVFSEQIDAGRDLCLMCMQYVPGTTLAKVIADTVMVDRAAMTRLGPSTQLRGVSTESWPSAPLAGEAPSVRQRQAIPAGQAILELVDSQNAEDVLLDLAALRDRERLSGLDLLETACWMGARLAEALAYAHARGVLHRDIKPANILINRYGRPLLVDFNVSAPCSPLGTSLDKDSVGGTRLYMAPEHLDASNPYHFMPGDPVDARSDIYSLGVVLYELLSGRLPFALPLPGPEDEMLQAMADQRRQGALPLDAELHAPPMFDRILGRCLAGNPFARYPNAGELAADLRNCLRMQRVRRDLPKGYFVTPLAVRYPFLVGLCLVLLPHVLATFVNIAYNWSRIVGHLSDHQQEMFWVVTGCYNLVMYPFTLGMYLRQVLPVYRVWRKLASPTEPISGAEVDATRRRALDVPRWGIGLSANAWLLGGGVFPLALHYCDPGYLTSSDALHFVISFTLSGLIAMTYSVIAMEFVVVRVLYPGLWLDARNMRAVAQKELRPSGRRLFIWQCLAVVIPIVGAILMIQGSPETVDAGYYRTFRLLVTGLLSLGMVGLGLTLIATSIVRETIAVLVSGWQGSVTR